VYVGSSDDGRSIGYRAVSMPRRAASSPTLSAWGENIALCAIDDNGHVYTASSHEGVELALVRRETNSAGFMPAYILPRQPFQLGIKLIAIGMHFGEIVAASNVRALPGGVPGGAGRKFVLFNQQAVGPTKFGKMVKQRSSHYAAANDDNPRRCLHDSRAPLGIKSA
jgi:hypothetical protein